MAPSRTVTPLAGSGWGLLVDDVGLAIWKMTSFTNACDKVRGSSKRETVVLNEFRDDRIL